MTGVSVLVPYRPDGGHRDAAWSWLRAWWGEHFPDWQLLTGSCPDGPWVKALAIANALDQADGDQLVIVDADVFCEPEAIRSAVELLDRCEWVMPHWRVVRLTEASSARVMAGDPPPPQDTRAGARLGVVQKSYKGKVGGGLIVLRRPTYEAVPLDPRFLGWGQEDTSWGVALMTMSGAWTRGSAPLYHLWHPPQERKSNHVGSREGWDLHRRYLAANNRDAMAALLAEAATAERAG